MDDQRDVQTFRRNGSYRSSVSSGSALAMEIKRKKIRESALFLQTEVRTSILKIVPFHVPLSTFVCNDS